MHGQAVLAYLKKCALVLHAGFRRMRVQPIFSQSAAQPSAGCATRLRRLVQEESRGPDPSWNR
jgi:hypothetical protein